MRTPGCSATRNRLSAAHHWPDGAVPAGAAAHDPPQVPDDDQPLDHARRHRGVALLSRAATGGDRSRSLLWRDARVVTTSVTWHRSCSRTASERGASSICGGRVSTRRSTTTMSSCRGHRSDVTTAAPTQPGLHIPGHRSQGSRPPRPGRSALVADARGAGADTRDRATPAVARPAGGAGGTGALECLQRRRPVAGNRERSRRQPSVRTNAPRRRCVGQRPRRPARWCRTGARTSPSPSGRARRPNGWVCSLRPSG